jgi:hypothetical protein
MWRSIVTQTTQIPISIAALFTIVIGDLKRALGDIDQAKRIDDLKLTRLLSGIL